VINTAERIKPKDAVSTERFLMNVGESFSNVDKLLEHIKNNWEQMDRLDKTHLIIASQLAILSDENIGKIAEDLSSKSNVTGDDIIEQTYCDVKDYLEDLRGIKND